jgi:membrane fusion protein (multidrug efflux system)
MSSAPSSLRPVTAETAPRPAGPPGPQTVSPGEPPPGERAAPPARKRPPIGILVLVIVLLGFGAFGLNRWLYGRNHVHSDNAQVEGHVIPVIPRVLGYVTAVEVSENEPVKEGQLLFELDDRDYRAKLVQSQADFAAAQAAAGASSGTGQAEAQVAAARASVLAARANASRAESDYKRYQELAPRGVISAQQLDAARAAAEGTRAELDAAQKQVAAARANLESASAKREAAAAAVEQSRLNVAWTKVYAPASGLVSRKNIEVGQLVQAGQPTMSLVPLDDVWIVANLKETELRDVNPGDPVEVEVDTYPGRKFAGKVESISAATGARFSLLPPDNSTGNFTKVVQRIPVRIRLDPGADRDHSLRPGMSAVVTITTR